MRFRHGDVSNQVTSLDTRLFHISHGASEHVGARRQWIISTARTLAEAEGWDAVTTRRLSIEIEYSQPVLSTLQRPGPSR